MEETMAIPHVIALPYPAQGHVNPMLELSHWLVSHGVKVTFVNTHFNHRRVVESSSSEIGEAVSMVSISDGTDDALDDKSDMGKHTEAMLRVMPTEMEALITKLNRNGGPKITCVLADYSMAWAVDAAAERHGLRTAVFCPSAAAYLALCFSIPQLIANGFIDENGRPLSRKQTIQLSPTIPAINSDDFSWLCYRNEVADANIFKMLFKCNSSVKSADWVICNSSHDLEAGTFSKFPKFKPIGPLLGQAKPAGGSFWAEDSTCLAWLDQQPPNSVIYIAFGSFTNFDPTQFQELAIGLELLNRPFLWVVRQDMTDGAGFKERVGERGRVVGWAPQQQVLRHPSVACFVSHCGWNSTIEGVSNGVPFLCWPYFADQFVNSSYICDEWKVGLGLSKDERGIITREEIKEKVEILLSGGYKERILNLRAKVVDGVRAGGRSHANFTNFVDWINNIV